MTIKNLGGIIKVKVYPKIYAFRTNDVGDDCLKIGITYRTVSEREKEWRKKYPYLTMVYEREARIGNSFIGDDAIFKCLTTILNKYRLVKKDFNKGVPFCDEFFRDVTTEDIDKSFDIIEESVNRGEQMYKLYNECQLPEVNAYIRGTELYIPRKNQKKAIDKFEKIWKKQKKSLLNASMRYGKSYVTMECALVMGAKIVVIVSAKADVKDEWNKTVSQIANFDGFVFLDSKNLENNANVIKENIENGNKVAIFLTLQDLMGDGIKKKHLEVFNNEIDLLVVDETHYGARAEKYGRVLHQAQLKSAGLTDEQVKYEMEQSDCDTDNDGYNCDNIHKCLNAKHTMHVSGTPFRILMSGEFSDDNILVNIQYSDMIDARNEWVANNNALEHPEDDDANPYYGFPDLLRFGLNANESSQRKLNQLKELGKSYGLSTLFTPLSLIKDVNNNYKKFEFETEVMDWLLAFDGSKEDKNVLPVLELDEAKKSDMCCHIVIALPYRASCDALEALIKNNSHLLKNLSGYEIINIAGVDSKLIYPTMKEVKSKIKYLAEGGKKTITLTAVRGLTGVTVEEWDTMIFLKDMSSPQEYEQAVGRLFTPYIGTLKADDGNSMNIVKKPQVVLIDFDPNRMFRLQEEKSRIYNYNAGEKGNDNLEKRLRKELDLFPIITYNCNKIHKVEPVDIMNVVREYMLNRSIEDDSRDIPVDDKMLFNNDFIKIIKRFNRIASSKGIEQQATQSKDDDDLNIPDIYKDLNLSTKIKGKKIKSQKDIIKELQGKCQAYYRQILLFVLCTDSKDVKSLNDVIDVLTATDDNKCISTHLKLNVEELKFLREICSPDTLHYLDYKIANTKERSVDETVEPMVRAEIILKELRKISDSEIVTPKDIADSMTSLLSKYIDSIVDKKILDIASKRGEFAMAIYKRFINEYPDIKNNIYSLPTSGIGYVLTCKMYKLLGMPVENVISDFTTNDLIGKDKSHKDILKKLKNMKFDVVIGNPPYHEKDGGAGSSSKPLYHKFIEQIKKLNPQILTLIIPSKWYAGGKGLNEFRNNMLQDNHIKVIHDFNDASDCFNNVSIKGGVCYFLWDKDYQGDCEVNNHIKDTIVSSMKRPLLEEGCDSFIRHNEAISILRKVQSQNETSFSSIVSSRKPFGLPTNFDDFKDVEFENSVKIYANQKTGYVDRKHILKHHNWICRYKIVIPEAIGVGDMSKDVLKPIIAGHNTCCTETYIVVGPFDNEVDVKNVYSYMQTKFFHLMLGLKKISQHTTSKVYQFVPLQNFTPDSDIDWNKSIAEIDMQLYAKYDLVANEIAFIESKIKTDK